MQVLLFLIGIEISRKWKNKTDHIDMLFPLHVIQKNQEDEYLNL